MALWLLAKLSIALLIDDHTNSEYYYVACINIIPGGLVFNTGIDTFCSEVCETGDAPEGGTDCGRG